MEFEGLRVLMLCVFPTAGVCLCVFFEVILIQWVVGVD
jgi:hypothetical protein